MKKIKITLIVLLLLKLSSIHSQWVNTNNNDGLCFAKNSNNNILFGTWFNGVFYSSNNGDSWTNIFQNHTVHDIVVIGNKIFVGTAENGIYLTTNNGILWTTVNNGLPGYFISHLAVNGTNIYSSVGASGVFLSTDYGSSWTNINNGISAPYVSVLESIGSSVIFGTDHYFNINAGLYISTNGGTMWNNIYSGLGSGYQTVSSISFNGTNIFAGLVGSVSISGGIFVTSNNGSVWVNLNNDLPNPNVQALVLNANNIYLGNDWGLSDGGVFISTNNGQNWINKSTGLNIIQIVFYKLFIINNYIFAGTNSGTYRRSLAELTGIQPINNNIPNKFTLSQNYPNPFNPSTTINYQLPKSSDVKLVVYDIMGREVKTLVNEKQNAGSYQVQFEGSNLASGIYFYKLTILDPETSSGLAFSETKKMSLIK